MSEVVLSRNKEEILELARMKKVKYVALSRKSLPTYLPLLRQLEDAGVKAFVYHVNFERGKDEQYVVEKELGDGVFGMYADMWSFDKSK